MFVKLNRLNASPINDSLTRSRMRNSRPTRRSTLAKLGPLKALRTAPGKRDEDRAVPELFTTAPVRPPAGPPDALPFMVGVIGWPEEMVTMLANVNPSRI